MNGNTGITAVIIPVYGEQHLTRALWSDLWPQVDEKDVVIIDNKGDYERFTNERVLSPGQNLGWLKACNLGLQAVANQYQNYLLLNNDTRLSRLYLRGLEQAQQATQGWLIAGCYDCVYEHQWLSNGYKADAQWWAGQNIERQAKFVDGTAMLITQQCIDSIGLLDDSFANYGWGADFDYALRIRQAGGSIWVTERSYLNHLKQGTARHIENYEGLAGNEMEQGMTKLWGPEWRDLLYG